MDIQKIVGHTFFDSKGVLDSYIAAVLRDEVSDDFVPALLWFVKMFFAWVEKMPTIDGYQKYLVLGQLVYAHKIDICRAITDSERYEVISALYNKEEDSRSFTVYALDLVNRYINQIRQRVNGSIVFPINIYVFTLNRLFSVQYKYNRRIDEDEIKAYSVITAPSVLGTYILHAAPTIQLRRPSSIDYNINSEGKIVDLPIHTVNYTISEDEKGKVISSLNILKIFRSDLPISYIQTLSIMNSDLPQLSGWCQPFYSSCVFERINVHLGDEVFYFFSPQLNKVKQSPYDLDGLLITKNHHPGFDFSLIHGAFITSKLSVMTKVVQFSIAGKYSIENLEGLLNYLNSNRQRKYEFGYQDLYDYDNSVITTVITEKDYNWDSENKILHFTNFVPNNQ